MFDTTQPLRDRFGDRLKLGEPLSRHTNFRIGGPARWFVEVKNEEEILAAVMISKMGEVPLLILGGGSNVLASDLGFDGLVIKIALRLFAIEGTKVIADAGVISSALARATVEAGLEGFEWAVSLPGTIGGAVRGNAGCFGGELKDSIVSVRVLREGTVQEVPGEACALGYRDSIFKKNADIILQATLQLKSGNTKLLKTRMEDQLAKRKLSQPTNGGSAGCIFQNYHIDSTTELTRLASDIPETMAKARVVSAGWLVEQADVKGQTIGQAQISPVHGNFIVNLGGATADDVSQLIALAKTRVRNRFGIQLMEEVERVGF